MAVFFPKKPDLSGTGTHCYRGYLLKHESRIGAFGGGQTRRKYWFALSQQSPFLYWYKAKTDVTPAGKIQLSGAAFTFDPRQQGIFEIHCGKDVYVLEAGNAQIRMEWLSRLQETRKNVYAANNNNETSKPKSTTALLIDLSEEVSDSGPPKETTQNPMNPIPVPTQKVPEAKSPEGAQFYLTQSGELNEKSFELPAENENGRRFVGAPVLGTKIEQEDSFDWDRTIRFRVKAMDKQHEDQLDTGHLFGTSCFKQQSGSLRNFGAYRSRSFCPADLAEAPAPVQDKSKNFRNKLPLKLPVLKTKQKANNCDGCKEFMSVVDTLKERCCDTEDELSAQKEVIHSLRISVASAKNQIEALKQISQIQDLPGRITHILERENHLTHLQVETTEQKRDIQELTDKNRELEAELSRAQSDLEAYKDSLRSKEELILKLVEAGDLQERPREMSDETLLDFGVDVAQSVDPGTPSVGSGGRLSFLSQTETEVKDIAEMDNLQVSLRAFEQQNAFLNKEIIDLQAVIRGLENREKDLIRKNFDLEALFYQLKSKYLLLLNHFKPTARGLNESDIETLIDDATRWSGVAPANPESLDNEGGVPGEHPEITDTLGFYMSEKRLLPWGKQDSEEITTPKDLLAIAAQYSKKSDAIRLQMNRESSAEHIAWVTRWDSFLVNLTSQKFIVVPSPELKSLIRTGVPHTYRSKVWKSLVQWRLKETLAELGNGYYDSLLKKSLARRETSFDSALKQIDLDLARTLPGNKFFTDADSGKMEQLRRVLYAYRWHNTQIGYCQGLNRLAAVGLLYLEEADAFWFLVASVEHLQPENYYTSTLLTALADQRVLTDLVNEKLPKIAAVLRQHETDLTMFTLSWFLTLFVDSLSHKVYFDIFDVFLYEGNKVLFRFALAALKICEPQICSCKNTGSLHSCISRIGEHVTDFNKLANIAFNELNPFPMKHIENRRQYHLNQLNAELSK